MARQGRISDRQQSIILDFMESHPDLRRGKFTPQFAATLKSQYWVQLTNMLNADGLGPTETEEKWTWIDWKSATKAKAARIRCLQNATGGGPVKEILTVVEERLMALISWHAATGFEGLREGGFELQCVLTPASTPVAASLTAATPSACTSQTTPTTTPPNTTSTTVTPTTAPQETLPSMYPEFFMANLLQEPLNISNSSQAQDITITTATSFTSPQETTTPTTFASPQETTTPTSQSRKRRRTHATASIFEETSAAYQRLEEANCASRQSIALGMNRLADASEQQAQGLHAVANGLNALAAAISNMSRRDL